MPFMGGMEATELIREHEMKHGLTPIPIIALTAHASKLLLSVFSLLLVVDSIS